MWLMVEAYGGIGFHKMWGFPRPAELTISLAKRTLPHVVNFVNRRSVTQCSWQIGLLACGYRGVKAITAL
jgi:hypothetical protein